MLRKALTVSIAALVGGAMFGALVSVTGTESAHASGCATHVECNEDTTVTSSLIVDHRYRPQATNDPVEWHYTDTWKVTAVWATDSSAPPSCSCEALKTDEVTVRVIANGSNGLAASCSGCSAGAIEDVDVCSEGKCDGGGNEHFWAYELIVDIDEHDEAQCVDGPEPVHLYSVTYDLVTGSDGQIVDTSDCSLGAQKDLIEDTYSNTDFGSFECGFSCDATGVTIDLLYEDP